MVHFSTKRSTAQSTWRLGEGRSSRWWCTGRVWCWTVKRSVGWWPEKSRIGKDWRSQWSSLRRWLVSHLNERRKNNRDRGVLMYAFDLPVAVNPNQEQLCVTDYFCSNNITAMIGCIHSTQLPQAKSAGNIWTVDTTSCQWECMETGQQNL